MGYTLQISFEPLDSYYDGLIQFTWWISALASNVDSLIAQEKKQLFYFLRIIELIVLKNIVFL
jgi:hypothetical protein